MMLNSTKHGFGKGTKRPQATRQYNRTGRAKSPENELKTTMHPDVTGRSWWAPCLLMYSSIPSPCSPRIKTGVMTGLAQNVLQAIREFLRKIASILTTDFLPSLLAARSACVFVRFPQGRLILLTDARGEQSMLSV